MRKTILAAGLGVLVAFTLAGCHKTREQTAPSNTAMENSAAPSNTSTAPPGRGDPTRQ